MPWRVGDTFLYHEVGNGERRFQTTVDLIPAHETPQHAARRRVVSPQHPIGRALMEARPGHQFYLEVAGGRRIVLVLDRVIPGGREIEPQELDRKKAQRPIPCPVDPVDPIDDGRYTNTCWNCHYGIDSTEDERCPRCHMFVCSRCGVCMCQWNG